MKLIGIVFIFLYLQASASFLDDFRTAISNVEHGFGKLLTDVVTDVKDTIHCTISAVEQVLVLNGLLDKTSSYSYRCSGSKRPTEPTKASSMTRDHRSVFDSINRIRYPDRVLDHQQSPKHISMELGKSIAYVNKTINDILRHPQRNSNLKIVSQTMKAETNRLTEISEILKRELENISSNISFEIKKLHLDRRKLSDESVWQQFKTLYDVQKSSNNRTEVDEVRKVLDSVVNRLHLNLDNSRDVGNYDLKEIRKKLEKYSDSDDMIKQDTYVNPRSQDLPFHKLEMDSKPQTFEDLASKIMNDNKNVDDNQSATENSVFGLDLDAFKYLSPFSNDQTDNKKIVSDAKKIIEDSLHSDKILKNFFDDHKSGTDVFSDPELFNFGQS